MCLKRFFLIFVLLFGLLFLWKCCSTKLHNIHALNIKIQYDISERTIKPNLNEIVNVKTDVMDLKINLYDGDIYQGRLLKYQEALTCFKKLELISDHNPKQNIISGLMDNQENIFHSLKKIPYKIDRLSFRLLNDRKILMVPITLDLKNNVHIVKTFIFKKGSYDIGIEYKIYNHGVQSMLYHIYGGLKQQSFNENNNLNTQHQFENIAYSNDHKKYQKFSLYTMEHHQQIYYTSKSGWITLLKKYFSIGWILNDLGKNHVCIFHKIQHNVVLFYKTQGFTILPDNKIIKRTILWFGPKIQNKILLIAPYFDFIIDYGWFWFLSKPLFDLLNILHYFLNNWGYSIILITCIIRIITYPLLKAQYLATVKMKLLQPEINHIKTKFKNNRKIINSKILELYKNNNINPFSGLLPILLQMPIFLALYYMLVNTIELRHAPFILWINDLSAQDPLYILPIIMGITIFFMQKTAPVNYFPLSLKEKIINFSPILFVCFFLWFPAGLVLYYIVSNIVTILQQIIIRWTLKNNKMYN